MLKFVLINFGLSQMDVRPIDMRKIFPITWRRSQANTPELIFGNPTAEDVEAALQLESLPVEHRIHTLLKLKNHFDKQIPLTRTTDAYPSYIMLLPMIDVRLFKLFARYHSRKLYPDEIHLHTACEIVAFVKSKYPASEFSYLTPDYVMLWYRLSNLPWLTLWGKKKQMLLYDTSGGTDDRVPMILQMPDVRFGTDVLHPRIERLINTGYEFDIAGPIPAAVWNNSGAMVSVQTKNFGKIFLQKFYPEVVQAEFMTMVLRKDLRASLDLRISRLGKSFDLELGDESIHQERLGPLDALIASIPKQRRLELMSDLMAVRTRKKLHEYNELLTDEIERVYAHYTLSSLYIPESVVRLLLLIRQEQAYESPFLIPVSASTISNYFIQQQPHIEFITPEFVLEWYNLISTQINYKLFHATADVVGAIPTYVFDLSSWKSAILATRIRRLQETGSQKRTTIEKSSNDL